MIMTASSVARALDGKANGRGFTCRCPVPSHGQGHGDRNPSLSVWDEDGRICVCCHAGCKTTDVIAELRGRGLWPEREERPRREFVFEYRHPETGEVRYRKRRLDGGEGKKVWFDPKKRGGSPPLLYGGERLADIGEGQSVFIVEGEVKVDRLRALGQVGVSADSGAKSKWLPSHAQLLSGLDVILWPDSDQPGEDYIAHAAACIGERAASLKVVRPFGKPNGVKGKDVCDWDGDIAALIESAETYAPLPASSQEITHGDARRKILCPHRDGELTPVIKILDEHLLTDETFPPMRSVEGWPVEVRMCEPIGLHELSASVANAEEDDEAVRLPPPASYNIVRHTAVSLSMLIERYLTFYSVTKTGEVVTKRLPSAFVSAYLEFERSRLPRVASIATMPMVLANGELLGGCGLDRRRKTAFCIDEDVVALTPKGPVGEEEVKEAMRFLTDEWLTDVSADAGGKCIIIALALTILERELLGERPAFFIRAGKRGGGKTTTAHMVSLAVFGQRAAAASWSPNEEERRKTVFAALLQGVPMICFDNIKRGSAVSCPTIEKMLTSAEMRDRVLGESREERVSSKTIVVFTGNNVGPKGDMASRSLVIQISVDRPDPENREFRHPDPFAWTLDNRGEIITALYTVLLGNPRLKQKPKDRSAPKTRFKEWWHLVGSAVEHASALTGHDVDFGKMFLDVEADDEETLTLAGLLPLLDRFSSGSPFSASDVTHWMELTGSDSASLFNDPDDVTTLRGFFSHRDGKMSVQAVTWRLKNECDAPVWIENEVWTLRSEKTAKKHVRFWLEKKDASPTA